VAVTFNSSSTIFGEPSLFKSVIVINTNKWELIGDYYELPGGIQIVYQIPEKGQVSGVLFLAHGCSHSATDWWPKSEFCQPCIGLPIERSIVQRALNSGMAVIAVSSSNRQNKCWVQNNDLLPVSKALQFLFEKIRIHAGTRPPLYLLGVSSGGSFVGYLAQKMTDLNVAALCV
jgi:hypothetical protein